MRISPLPKLPMTVAGGGLVLNAMVSVVPLAVASITPDWSGPVTAQFVESPLIVAARFLHRRFSGRRAVNVPLGSAARVHVRAEAR